MFDGAVAVVTGGESGLGAACIVAPGEARHMLLKPFHGRGGIAEGFSGRLQRYQSFIVQDDVGDETAVDALFGHDEAIFGTATLLVNSAGLT